MGSSGLLLTVLGRLFTTIIQKWGFTMGIDDLIINANKNQRRSELLAEVAIKGFEATCDFANIKANETSNNNNDDDDDDDDDSDDDNDGKKKKKTTLGVDLDDLSRELRHRLADEKESRRLDSKMGGVTHKYASEIIEE